MELVGGYDADDILPHLADLAAQMNQRLPFVMTRISAFSCQWQPMRSSKDKSAETSYNISGNMAFPCRRQQPDL